MPATGTGVLHSDMQFSEFLSQVNNSKPSEVMLSGSYSWVDSVFKCGNVHIVVLLRRMTSILCGHAWLQI